MNSTVFSVEQAGIFTTLQDAGRQSATHLGIAPSGFADRYSAVWANRLVQNPDATCVLEIAYGGLVVKAQKSCQIAVCGADMPLRINGEKKESWRSHLLVKSDVLEVEMARAGLRAYLSVSGGIVANSVFGSCATNVREKLGGLESDGLALKDGDILMQQPVDTPIYDLRAPVAAIPNFPRSLNLRFIKGYQYKLFSNAQLNRLCLNHFTVSERMDRMGVQLTGHKLTAPNMNLLSEAICLGAIQVPLDGHPIVMLNDRQTIGGYPKLGSLLSSDINKLAQAKPGIKIKLEAIELEHAHNVLHLEQTKNNQLKPVAC